MKKLIFYFALLASFCSCSKDETSNQDQIIGKWYLVIDHSITRYPDGKILTDTTIYNSEEYLDIRKDGKVISKFYYQTLKDYIFDTFPYHIIQNNIVFDSDTFEINKLNQTELELHHHNQLITPDFPQDGEVESWITCKR
jgi:hypothetical protein